MRQHPIRRCLGNYLIQMIDNRFKRARMSVIAQFASHSVRSSPPLLLVSSILVKLTRHMSHRCGVAAVRSCENISSIYTISSIEIRGVCACVCLCVGRQLNHYIQTCGAQCTIAIMVRSLNARSRSLTTFVIWVRSAYGNGGNRWGGNNMWWLILEMVNLIYVTSLMLNKQYYRSNLLSNKTTKWFSEEQYYFLIHFGRYLQNVVFFCASFDLCSRCGNIRGRYLLLIIKCRTFVMIQ